MKNLTLTAVTLCLSTTISTPAISAERTHTYSQPRTYVGIDVFSGKSNLDLTLRNSYSSVSDNKDFDQTGIRLKLGACLADNTRFEVYIKNEHFKEAFDNHVYGFGLNAIKSFPLDNKLAPFILGGFVADSTKLNDTVSSNDNLNALGFKLGGGVLYPLNTQIEIMAGLDWQYRKWKDISFSHSSTIAEQKDTSKTLYAGINFLF
jgi:opacity protein-like surface antigen